MRIYGTSPLYNYVELIFRCKRMFILAILLGALITSWMVRRRTDMYEASTLIALTGKVDVNSNFARISGTVTRKLNNLGFWIKKVPDFTENIAKAVWPNNAENAADIQKRADKIRDSVRVGSFGSGEYAELRLTWDKGPEAERILEELFSAFRNKSADTETASQEDMVITLQKQFKRAEAEADAMAQNKMRYIREHYWTQPNFLAYEITRQDQARNMVASTQTDLEDARARLAQIASQLRTTDREITISNKVTINKADPSQKLRSDKQEAETKLKELLQSYSEAHPLVIKQRQQIALLDQRIKEVASAPASDPGSRETETQRMVNPEYQKLVSQQNEFVQAIKAYERRLVALQEIVQKSEGRLMKMPQDEITYSRILRDYNTKNMIRNNQYALLQNANLQFQSDKEWERNSISMVVPPSSEKLDSGGKRMMLYMLGPFLGLLIAFCFSLLAEALDHTLRTPVEVEKYLGKPVLAVIPRMQAPREARKQLSGSSQQSISS